MPIRRFRVWGIRLAIAAIFAVGLGFLGSGVWIKAKAVVAQVLLDQAFLASVDQPVKPWPWADITPLAKISAPRLQASNVVINGTSGEAMAFGPGHMSSSADLGERGTAVFAAHRDTHFSWLGNLKPGDAVLIEMPSGRKLSYSVRRAWVARYDASGIDADSDEKLIALTTCWPLDGSSRGPLRYIVEAVETSDMPSPKSVSEEVRSGATGI